MHGEMMDDGRKDEEYSEMAWAIAARGKSGREIGFLHETWANAQTARGVLDKAQVLPLSRETARHGLHTYLRRRQAGDNIEAIYNTRLQRFSRYS